LPTASVTIREKSEIILATDLLIEQRLCKGPCLAERNMPTSEFFPIRISIVPGSFRSKYKPKQEWDTNRAFPDIQYPEGLKAGSTQMHSIRNHTDAVQYGKHKEEGASEGDYRYDFEGWDDVPILENRTKPRIHSSLQRELFKPRSCFQKRRSGILDRAEGKNNACYWILILVLPLSQTTRG
jgi:hypothetical protein